MFSLQWREEYSLDIDEMDDHHIELFERINKLFDAYYNDEEEQVVSEVLNYLMDYTIFHFKSEEDLMESYDYPDLPKHKRMHEQLMVKLVNFRNEIVVNNIGLNTDFFKFLKEWLLFHILTEDRKYSIFIRAKTEAANASSRNQ